MDDVKTMAPPSLTRGASRCTLKNAPFVLMSKTGQRSLGHFVKRLEPGEPDIDVEEVDGAEDCVHRSGQLVDRGEIGASDRTTCAAEPSSA